MIIVAVAPAVSAWIAEEIGTPIFEDRESQQQDADDQPRIADVQNEQQLLRPC